MPNINKIHPTIHAPVKCASICTYIHAYIGRQTAFQKPLFHIQRGSKCANPPKSQEQFLAITILSHMYYVYEKVRRATMMK
jgi:hypothetical protein